jgi:hypothetical protein
MSEPYNLSHASNVKERLKLLSCDQDAREMRFIGEREPSSASHAIWRRESGFDNLRSERVSLITFLMPPAVKERLEPFS